jgi:hypothetical protein
LEFINYAVFKLHYLNFAVVLKSIKRDDDDDDDDDNNTGFCEVYPVNWLVGQMRNA